MYVQRKRLNESRNAARNDGFVRSCPDERGNPERWWCTIGDVMVVAAMTVGYGW